MAGIYIHIPFCRKLCNYCDFFRIIDFKKKKELLACMIKELDINKNYLKGEVIETIYIGGGTPSVLSVDEINILFEKIFTFYDIENDVEITFEANPDDLTKQYLKKLKNNTPVNRLSIGVQSFIDKYLILMNRRHNSNGAIDAIHSAQDIGYGNISIDLIYGLPGLSIKDWKYNLILAFSFGIKHLSAYCLTFEKDTPFYLMLKDGKIFQPTEDENIDQYKLLMEIAKDKKFIHYEISNFAEQNYFSKHNSNYWMQKKYLGIGPSAHSYNLNSRRWNVSDINKYIEKINNNNIFFETEHLDSKTRFNEYLLTGLRTMWGVNINKIKNEYGNIFFEHFASNIRRFKEDYEIIEEQNRLFLSEKGKFIADYIISELMMV